MSDKFKAIVIDNQNEKFTREIKEIDKTQLKDGNVLVKVDYSSLNYKDALILNDGGKIVRKFPFVRGIDFSGTVVESEDSKFTKDDKVILTGFRVGEAYFGGFSQYAKVDSNFLIKIPKELDTHKAMMLGTAGFTALLCSFAVKAKEELFIYNWSDYIAEDTIANFESEFGIDVTYDVFDSNEVLEAKLLAGGSGYDIVVPSGSFLENQIKAGVFQKLDKSKLSNLGNLDPNVLAKIDAHDPGGNYSVNYMYGTTGVGYNVDKVDEDEITSWSVLFDPAIAAKYEDCGISMLDAPSEVMEIALKYIGKDPYTEDEKDYEAALEMLQKIRPFIRYFDSSQYIDDLANGEICLAMGWSGDVFIAADEAAEGVEAWYSIPSEGTVIWFDMMAIPSDAKNVENAHKFINYIMRPQVAADITNYVWYSNPNQAANELVDPEIFEDPAIYPDEATLSMLFADTADSPKKAKLSSKYFNKFKSN